MTYEYHPEILDELSRYGLRPLASTPPGFLRDAVRELYKYEIRALRSALLAGDIARPDYAGRVEALRKRYWLLSVPVDRWVRAAG